jgi:predicted SAM-dependent methyltransferase
MAKNKPGPFLWKLRMILEYKLVMPVLLLLKRLFFLLFGQKSVRVNIGGGNFIKPGWLSMDYQSETYPYRLSLLDQNFDLTSGKPFPFEENSVDFFYSQHTLEHIPQEHCAFIFAEMYRCLKPGGAVRLNMPDYDIAYRAAKAGNLDFFPDRERIRSSFALCLLDRFATGLIGRVDVAEVERDLATLEKDEFAEKYAAAVPRETQLENFGNHINWWNYAKLERMFKAAGFSQAYGSGPQQSRFAEMRGKGHFLGLEKLVALDKLTGFDSAHQEQSVYGEAVK